MANVHRSARSCRPVSPSRPTPRTLLAAVRKPAPCLTRRPARFQPLAHSYEEWMGLGLLEEARQHAPGKMLVQSRQQADHLAVDDRCREEPSRRCTTCGREPYPKLQLVANARRRPRVVDQKSEDR